jgi:hypothetical protein
VKSQGLLRALAAACFLVGASDAICWGQEDAIDSAAPWWQGSSIRRAAWSLDESLTDVVIDAPAAPGPAPAAAKSPLDPPAGPADPAAATIPAPPGDGGLPVRSVITLDRAESGPPESEDHPADRWDAKPGSETLPLKITGQIQVDALWFSQSEASRIAVGDAPDAFDFRRARLASRARRATCSITLGVDFALGTASKGRPQFLDVFLGIKDLPYVNNLRVGTSLSPSASNG